MPVLYILDLFCLCRTTLTVLTLAWALCSFEIVYIEMIELHQLPQCLHLSPPLPLVAQT